MNELKPEDVMRAREALDRIQNFCEEIDYHLPPDEQTGYKMLPDWMIVFEFLNEAEALLREKDAEIERLQKLVRTEVQIASDEVKEVRETARSEAIKEFLKAVDDAISNLEYNAKLKRKTVTVDMLLDQVNWVLHTIVPRRIKQLAADLLDDFPNCKISGCEAARKDCHIGCPHGKENNDDSGTKV